MFYIQNLHYANPFSVNDQVNDLLVIFLRHVSKFSKVSTILIIVNLGKILNAIQKGMTSISEISSNIVKIMLNICNMGSAIK